MGTTWRKFDRINYKKQFLPGIKQSHRLLEYALKKYRVRGQVIDLGGGPGISAKILGTLGTAAKVFNVEPTRHSKAYRGKTYFPIKMTLQQALERGRLPAKADCLIACSSLHEIALSFKKGCEGNKKALFILLQKVIAKLRPGSLFIIVEIDYKKTATGQDIQKHLWIAEHTIGHDHLRSDLLTVQELKRGIGLRLVESRRLLQTHSYKGRTSKIVWSKLLVFREDGQTRPRHQ